MKEKIKKLLMQVDKELIIDNLMRFDFFNDIESDEDIPDNPFFEDYPTCVYTGELLKKNLKSSKVQDPNAKIYQRQASIVKKAEK